METRAIILFTRLPVAGMVKTRLMPLLDGLACADLQWALLADLAPIIRSAEADLFVFYAPAGLEQPLQQLQQLYGPSNYLPQQGHGLGQRMDIALTYVFRQGYDRCLLLGSDIPFISSEDIIAAWEVLCEHDAVFGPCEDGGFWLVGLNEPFPQLFMSKTYGHDSVLAQAQEVCSIHKLSAGLVAIKRDIDSWDDLLYCGQVAKQGNSPSLYKFMQLLGAAT